MSHRSSMLNGVPLPRRPARCLLAAGAILVSLWTVSRADPPVAAPTYEVVSTARTDPPGTADAYAISPSGVIVGTITEAGGKQIDFRELLSDDEQCLRYLDPFGRASTQVLGINAFCEVVGSVTAPGGRERATLFNRQKQLIDLSARLGGAISRARGINDAGDAVGSAIVSTGTEHAILWRSLPPNQPPSAAETIDLGTLGGATSLAYAINNAGQVVGAADTSAGPRHAFLWPDPAGSAPPRLRDLGTLGGPSSEARALNAAGQVVGSATTARGEQRACRWTARGIEDLGTLGGRESVALGINTEGQIVGASDTADGRQHAFLYLDGIGMLDLNEQMDLPLGEQWELLAARGINDVGWIVGSARVKGEVEAVVLKPFGGQTPPLPPAGSACGAGGAGACSLPETPTIVAGPRTRLAVFRPDTREWTVFNNPSSSKEPRTTTVPFGSPDSTPHPADYRGTGRAQLAVVRLDLTRNMLEWTIRQDDRTTIGPIYFGEPGDQPVPARYLEQRHAQIAVYRPSTGQWWIRRTLDPNDTRTVDPISLGQPGDVPVPAPYFFRQPDAIAVFRPSTAEWLVRKPDGSKTFTVRFGLPGDRPVPAQYEFDEAELAVVRRNNARGTLDWFIRGAVVGVNEGPPPKDTKGPIPFGQIAEGDVPVPGAYLPNLPALIAVYRPASATGPGMWLIRPDTEPDTQPLPGIALGGVGEQPIPAAYTYRLGQ